MSAYLEQIEPVLPALVQEVLDAGELSPATKLLVAVFTDSDTAFALDRMIKTIAWEVLDRVAEGRP